MNKVLIIGLLAATAIAGASIAQEVQKRHDPLKDAPVDATAACTSFLVYDMSRKTVHAYKRKHPCKGETPHKMDGTK